MYRLLGMAVWHGGRWYLRHRYGQVPRHRRALITAGVVAIAVGGIAVAGRRSAAPPARV
jgi:hypothetical protein